MCLDDIEEMRELEQRLPELKRKRDSLQDDMTAKKNELRDIDEELKAHESIKNKLIVQRKELSNSFSEWRKLVPRKRGIEAKLEDLRNEVGSEGEEAKMKNIWRRACLIAGKKLSKFQVSLVC